MKMDISEWKWFNSVIAVNGPFGLPGPFTAIAEFYEFQNGNGSILQ